MPFYQGLPRITTLLLVSAVLTACGGSGGSSGSARSFSDAAVIATGAFNSAGSASGAVELIDLTRTPLHSSGGYFPVPSSDISVNAYGPHYYRIGRFQFDTVQKVDIGNPGAAEWEFSTLEAGDQASSNPHTLVFVSDTKAYLLRYGSTHAWIVNPSATRESDFKIGELDLSHYNGGDNTVPNMTSGVIVGDRLFIVLQRLNADFSRGNPPYVAVFDVHTDTEIDTGTGTGLPGIQLQSLNPSGIAYHPDVGVLVQGVGDYGFPLNGGIDHIDPDTYAMTQLIDDTADTGAISGMALRDADTAYFISYAGWGDNHVFRFNPLTGEVATDAPVAGALHRNIAALAFSPGGQLWIADATDNDHGIRVVDPATDAEQAFVPTALPPLSLSFIASE